MDLILYGTGHYAIRVRKMIDFIKELKIVAITNSLPESWGTYFENYKILAPELAFKIKFDKILIASVYVEEIKQKLFSYNIASYKIIPNTMYFLHKYWISMQYNKHYSIPCTPTINFTYISETEPITIYTALFGDYDELHAPQFIMDNCEYICFTDSKNLSSDIWNIQYVDCPLSLNPNRAAKIYKILPHKFLQNNSKISIWIDSNFTLTGNLRTLINMQQFDSGILCCIHPDRDCIFDEAKRCIERNKDDPNIIKKQINLYLKENYPRHNTLISGGFIIRYHNHPNIIRFMETWWKEIQSYSKRDQLSFNYVAWKYGYPFDYLNIDIYNNPYFFIRKHKHEKE